MDHDNSRREQTTRGRRRRRSILIACAGVAIVAIVITIGIAVGRLQNNLTAVELHDPSSQTAEDSSTPASPLNILMLGSDGREAGDGAYGEDDGTMRSDAMVLVHIGSENGYVDAVQIPRDTVLQLPPCDDSGRGAFAGGYGMINGALNHGETCSVSAVEELTGVAIDHVVAMNFDGFADIVDALGGVQVCLPEALRDRRADLDLPAGEQMVSGSEALALARTRHAVGDGSDVARMGHQQMVMSAIVQRATSNDVLVRPDRLYSFLDAVTSSITVDTGLESLTQLAALAQRLSQVETDNITFVTMPWEAAPSDRNRVVPTPAAHAMFEALADDTRLATASGDQPPSDADSSHDQNPNADDADDTQDSDPSTHSRSADAPLCEDQ
ncbi:LCP family protein [Paramicrobacterium chengjingii]|uniref:LCP family protein n=1 Tax=Paramicrobacterium chengjingii TaxID=2769067 RepID=UPI00141F5451|nr:LCP family protein [Microbacterium chengjingii]